MVNSIARQCQICILCRNHLHIHIIQFSFPLVVCRRSKPRRKKKFVLISTFQPRSEMESRRLPRKRVCYLCKSADHIMAVCPMKETNSVNCPSCLRTVHKPEDHAVWCELKTLVSKPLESSTNPRSSETIRYSFTNPPTVKSKDKVLSFRNRNSIQIGPSIFVKRINNNEFELTKPISAVMRTKVRSPDTVFVLHALQIELSHCKIINKLYHPHDQMANHLVLLEFVTGADLMFSIEMRKKKKTYAVTADLVQEQKARPLAIGQGA